MGGKSNIDWTEKTWNPTTGCTKISAGCRGCYAETMAKRLKAMGNPRYKNGFNLTLHHDLIDLPLNWEKPSMIFVDSMSDLFHEDIPDQFIIDVFLTMSRAKHHTFQILTKRARRMQLFFEDCLSLPPIFPLSNVWLGVSVENQTAADERIPLLLETPAAIRFISAEPLLEKIQIPQISYRQIGPVCSSCTGAGHYHDNFNTPCPDCEGSGINPTALHWVICGGESGPNCRPMNLDWARDLRDQCIEANIPFFLKQLGGFPDKRSHEKAILDGRQWRQIPN